MEVPAHERVLAGCFRLCVLSALGILFLGGAALFLGWRLGRADELPPGYLGSPQRGRMLVSQYGCPACHVVTSADVKGMVGPSLLGMANRSYIAGRFANEPIDMLRWLQHPQLMKPGTSMPDVGVTERDAHDIAAYLATLR